jgi:inorganic pyrophosphatase
MVALPFSPDIVGLGPYRGAKMPASAAKRAKLQPVDKERKLLNVVIETPKGRRNKFKFDPEIKQFKLSKVLPAGATFPFDFGFLPGTTADDGDPVDVLLLMDESAFPGCIVEARLIGVIEAEQTNDAETVRNDRLIAVAKEAHDYGDLKRAADLNDKLVREYEHFFASYHEINGTQFKVLGVRGPKRAWKLVQSAIKKSRGAS